MAEATASISQGVLTVDAVAQGPVEGMKLWWSWSLDRDWSEAGQAPWSSQVLTLVGGRWTGTVNLTAAGVQDRAIGWFVESSNTLTLGATEYARKDASPVRFLQLPAAHTCGPPVQQLCQGH